jgi:hypothetical protein
MAVVTLTNDQRIAMKANSRFQILVRFSIYNQANYWKNIDGANPVDAAAAQRWAKSRFLSYGIIQNPTGIHFESWLEQYVIILKDIAVVDNVANPDPEAAGFYDSVLDYMIENSKFDELADLVFNLRIQKVEF